MAVYGLKPVAEIQFMGFIFPALNQLFAHAARLRNRSRGRFNVPLVMRTPWGAGAGALEHMPYPQSAILAIGRIKEFPVVKNKKIVIGKQAPLSLSFDHRLIDGADAARFVNRIIDEISKPEDLLK